MRLWGRPSIASASGRCIGRVQLANDGSPGRGWASHMIFLEQEWGDTRRTDGTLSSMGFTHMAWHVRAGVAGRREEWGPELVLIDELALQLRAENPGRIWRSGRGGSESRRSGTCVRRTTRPRRSSPTWIGLFCPIPHMAERRKAETSLGKNRENREGDNERV
ncbi:hypothetical protein VTK73DRAFT_8680 [Phialemonium thermophilum]|uniref:Uncharacterized protein n=1 Tax=Phialemonium thermophilum TaxID=223376 RepID=A0ABR3W6Z1_9PEZI